MTMFKYQEEFDFVLNLVQEVAEIFTPAFYSNKDIESKAFDSDLVTETDKALEAAIFGTIRKKYSLDNLIGEESCDLDVIFDNRRTWIVDPIDGTTNFIHKNPECCICIGFTVNKKTELGIIYCPVLHDLYSARRGFGATLNGRPISVSATTSLNKALISTYMFPKVSLGMAENCETIKKLCGDIEGPCHGLRMGGSSAVMLSQVAAGSVDAFWMEGLHIWDMTAAVIIIFEAGGVVLSTTPGEVFDLTRRNVVAACSMELGLELQRRVVRVKEGFYEQEPHLSSNV